MLCRSSLGDSANQTDSANEAMPVPAVRQRKPGKQERIVAPFKDVSTAASSGWRRYWVYFVLFALTTTASLLVLAYFTSPTTSILIEDGHDISQVKWASQSNTDLLRGTRILQQLHGAESIAVDADGNWYTGLEDGRIVKITNGDDEFPSITEIGFAKLQVDGERTKKRPLGLRLVQNRLFVADGYQGIFVIDLKKKKWDKIVGYKDVSPPMMFPDDLTISADGQTIYFTDISTRWMYHEVMFSFIEGECTGRVFKVTVSTKKIELIRDSLCFPNGIQLNPEENLLLVSENGRQRPSILDAISGEKTKMILLHGGPDNIRPAKSGGYWVAVPNLHGPIDEILRGYPFIRDLLAGILGAKHLIKIPNLKQGTAVRLDENFDVVSVHSDGNGKLSWALTEVQELGGGQFLLASFIANGIVKLDQTDMH